MKKNVRAKLVLAVLCVGFSIGCASEARAQWPTNEVMLRDGTIVNANPLMGVDANYVDLGDGRMAYRANVSVICLYDCKGAPGESFAKDLVVMKDGQRRFGKIKVIKGWTDNYVVLSGKKIIFTEIRYIKFADPVP
ncbi:MAG TPA: hypothetical protein VJS44_09890 [Pyrinomonadaceae bacterium]|nr:hypothetical protein [Pyrinomonadaceae bacterium]